MHSQPFLGDCARHSRCQPFESLELDANGWCRVLSLVVLWMHEWMSVYWNFWVFIMSDSVWVSPTWDMMKTWGKLGISWWSVYWWVGTVHIFGSAKEHQTLCCAAACKDIASCRPLAWMQNWMKKSANNPTVQQTPPLVHLLKMRLSLWQSCSFAQSLAGSPCSMVFINGFM